MAAIPVEVNSFLESVNLSDLKNKTRVTNLFNAHQPSVLKQIENYTTDESYSEATSETAGLAIANAFKFAFNLLTLRSILPFLNLNTAGSGVVSSTGIDQNKTNLLSHDQVQKIQRSHELEALKMLNPYLSEEGKIQLVNLSGKKKSKVKAAILGEDEEAASTPWWRSGDYDESLW